MPRKEAASTKRFDEQMRRRSLRDHLSRFVKALTLERVRTGDEFLYKPPPRRMPSYTACLAGACSRSTIARL